MILYIRVYAWSIYNVAIMPLLAPSFSLVAKGLISNMEAAVPPSREQFNGPNHFIVTCSKNIHCTQSVLISAIHLLTRSSLTACPANSMPRFVTAATTVYMTARSGTSGLRDHCYHERRRLEDEDSRSSGFPYLLPLATVCFPYSVIVLSAFDDNRYLRVSKSSSPRIVELDLRLAFVAC